MKRVTLVIPNRETGLVEWICSHGVGHPLYPSAERVAAKHGHLVHTWMLHGCDGCCNSEEFKKAELIYKLKEILMRTKKCPVVKQHCPLFDQSSNGRLWCNTNHDPEEWEVCPFPKKRKKLMLSNKLKDI